MHRLNHHVTRAAPASVAGPQHRNYFTFHVIPLVILCRHRLRVLRSPSVVVVRTMTANRKTVTARSQQNRGPGSECSVVYGRAL